jgi:hypothetical protein
MHSVIFLFYIQTFPDAHSTKSSLQGCFRSVCDWRLVWLIYFVVRDRRLFFELDIVKTAQSFCLLLNSFIRLQVWIEQQTRSNIPSNSEPASFSGLFSELSFSQIGQNLQSLINFLERFFLFEGRCRRTYLAFVLTIISAVQRSTFG